MNVRRATAHDLNALRTLLAGADLPTADLALDIGPFLLAETDDALAACAGLEQRGDTALLRSVAVAPRLRGRGLAIRLCAALLQAARALGVRNVYLLTTTARDFFAKIGFSHVPRTAAPESIRATREFRELCPDTSVLMYKVIGNDAASAVARLRDAYASFLRGDPAALLALFTHATVYHLPGGHLGGGRLEGRDAIVQRLATAAGAFDAPPQVDVVDAFGDDRVVVTTERFRARRGERSLDQVVHVVWLFAPAHCVAVWSHFADERACDAFWADWTA